MIELIFPNGAKVSFKDTGEMSPYPDKPTRPDIRHFVEHIRDYTEGNRDYLAILKMKLKDFSCQSKTWKGEK